jgi:hypothetical protein
MIAPTVARTNPPTPTTGTDDLLENVEYRPTIDEWNHLLAKAGIAYRAAHARRTVLESEFFRLNAYLVLSHIEDYLRLPDRLRTISAAKAPEAIVRQGLPLGTRRNFIGITAMMVHYFGGREMLVNLDEIHPAADLDDHVAVLDFWRRATIAMRCDGALLNSEATPPDSCRVADPAMIERIQADLIRAAPELIAVLRRFVAAVSSLCFLENCESRIATCDTGPYPTGDRRYLALRELITDRDGFYPWAAHAPHTLPHHRFVVALQLPAQVEMHTNLWGTAYFVPPDYLDRVLAFRVYTTDKGRLDPLTVHEFETLTETVLRVQRELYRHFSEMSVRERTFAGVQMYAWKMKSWALAAGCLDEIDWDISRRIREGYERFTDDRYAAKIVGDALVPLDRPSTFRPLE